MSVAAEAFAVEQAIEGTDVKILLQRFSDYLETLGTQPVTIPISNLAEDMLETFKLASSRAPICELRLRNLLKLESASFTQMPSYLPRKLLSDDLVAKAKTS